MLCYVPADASVHRSLLLASVVLLVLGKDVFSSREIFQLLYLCPLSGSVEKRTLTYSLCTAIMLDAVSRTIALSLKIGVNVFVPFIRRNAVLRKCCSNSNGIYILRKNQYHSCTHHLY